MNHNDSNRNYTDVPHSLHDGLNVDRMVQNAMDVAKRAVEQAGLAAAPNTDRQRSSSHSASRARSRAASLAQLQSETEQSATSVTIKLTFPTGAHPRQYRFFITSQALIWTDQQQQQRHSLPFPAFVAKRSARAVFHNRTLTIRIRKDQKDEPAHEIYVRYTD